jgi:general secretion pathway protein D
MHLMHVIESTVEPDTWEALSGPGAMSPVPQSGSLVIRQTLTVHRRVLQLLRDLRDSKRLGPPTPVAANAPAGK